MKTNAMNTWIRILVGVIIYALLMPAFALGQNGKDQKKQEKEAKENVKDEKRLDKTVDKYVETLAKANEKYAKNDDGE